MSCHPSLFRPSPFRSRGVYPMLLTLLLAASCTPRFAAQEADSPSAQEAPSVAALAAEPELGIEEGIAHTESAPAPPRAPARAKLPPLPPQRPVFPRVQPAALAGVSAERALAMLGRPLAARNAEGVSLWVYEHEACRLTLRFHFSVRDNELRALGYDIESGVEKGLPESICLHLLAPPETRIAGTHGRDES